MGIRCILSKYVSIFYIYEITESQLNKDDYRFCLYVWPSPYF